MDKTLRQLEAGRDLARLFGGKDRSDGVGQLALGLWFAEKLKGELPFAAELKDRVSQAGQQCGGIRQGQAVAETTPCSTCRTARRSAKYTLQRLTTSHMPSTQYARVPALARRPL